MIFQVIVEYSENSLSSVNVFSVTSLHAEDGTDYTFLIGYEEYFMSFEDLRQYLSRRLKVDPAEIELEEV